MLDRLIKNEYNIEKQIKELNLKLDTDYYSFHQRNKYFTLIWVYLLFSQIINRIVIRLSWIIYFLK